MRKGIIILCLGFVLAACSNGEPESTSKNVDTEPVGGQGLQKGIQDVSKEKETVLEQEEQQQPQQVKEEKGGQKNKREEESWQGEWIFIDDQVTGNLHIEEDKDNQIRYKLIGNRMGLTADNAYGSVFEGTGTITGDEVAFTNIVDEECGGVMKKTGSTLSFKAEDGNCHISVYLDGEYLKEEAIKTAPLLAYEEGQFFVYGIALGDAPSQTKEKVGNPIYEGPDEDGFYEWLQEYPSRHLLVAYTSDRQAESIHIEERADERDGAIALAQAFDGERYRNAEGTTYLYNPDNRQLLVLNQNGTNVSFFVTYADGNFHYGVENGSIKPY